MSSARKISPHPEQCPHVHIHTAVGFENRSILPCSTSRPAPLRPQTEQIYLHFQAMAKAAKEKTEFTVAPQNDSAKGSWHTATAGMYTKEGLAELRNSQAFTPKPSGGRLSERTTRGGGGGGGGNGDADTAAAGNEQVFAGDEAEMVHEAGQQGDLKEVSEVRGDIRGVCKSDGRPLSGGGWRGRAACTSPIGGCVEALVPGYVCPQYCCF